MNASRLVSTLALSALLLGGAASLATAAPAPAAAVAQADANAAPTPVPSPAATPNPSSSDDSEVRIEPLIWLPTTNASITVGDARFNRTLSLDGTVTPGQLLPHLHVAVAGRIEGREGRWGGFGEIFYSSDSQSAKIAGVGGTLNTKMTMGQIAGFYRVNPGEVPVDLVAGVRIAGLSNQLDFSSAHFAVLGNQGFDITKSRTNLYPIIGARVAFPVAKKLTFQVYGDYGGFGIGNDLQTWRAQGTFGYDVSQTTRMTLGYTAIGYSGNHGTNITRDKYNFTFHGPTVGISFKL